MQNYILIQIVALLLISKSMQKSDLTKINRINRINKKLNLIEEEAINQNRLIDAIEKDTFLPHQTISIDWSSKTTKLTQDFENKNDEVNQANYYQKDYLLIKDSHIRTNDNLEEEILSKDNAHKTKDRIQKSNHHTGVSNENLIRNIDESKTAHKVNIKNTRKKVWKKRNLIDTKQTSAMPYSTVSAALHHNTIDREQDATRYTINTYSAVSYNPPHHLLQYKQINIKQNNNLTILDIFLPSTFSLSKFDEFGSSTKNNQQNEYDEQFDLHNYKNYRKTHVTHQDQMTTPISIDNFEIGEFNKIRTRRTDKNEFISELDPKIIRFSDKTKSNEFDLLEHHQLLSTLNGLTRNLLNTSTGQSKIKNQVELRLNKTQVIKINWPVKKAVDLGGNISLGGLMMIHERDENYECGAIMPQGGIQVS